MNINNKFEYTRCILPDIGALEPEAQEQMRAEEEDRQIEKLRKEAKKLPVRLMEGSRKRDFPNKTPRELLNPVNEENRRRGAAEVERMEEWEKSVKERLRKFEYTPNI